MIFVWICKTCRLSIRDTDIDNAMEWQSSHNCVPVETAYKDSNGNNRVQRTTKVSP